MYVFTVVVERGDKIMVWDDAMNPHHETTLHEKNAWITTWSTAVFDTWENNLPSIKLEEGVVIRQTITTTEGGDRIKLNLSNEASYGAALDIAAVHIARPLEAGVVDGRIDLATDTALTFNGSESVSIPAKQTVWSDPIGFSVGEREKLVITIKLGKSVPYSPSQYSSQVSGHAGSRTDSFVGDVSKSVWAEDLSKTEKLERWYYISDLAVTSNTDTRAIVCLGDSITDGNSAVTNGDTRWTDFLAEHIRTAGLSYTVINKGIGGNSVANGGIGPKAINRFDRDVLSVDNAEMVIVLEGINDIGEKTDTALLAERKTAIVEGYKGFIKKAHDNGIKIYAATIMPCLGGSYGTEENNATRIEINEWIKENTNTAAMGEKGYDINKYDGLIDLAAFMEDPQKPGWLINEYQADRLHPNPTGYKAMGQYIFDALFVNK